MNARPHTHTLSIRDHGTFWGITYGDQTSTPDKPKFRKPKPVLRNAVRAIIAKHDRESVKAGDRTDDRVVDAALLALTPGDPTRWGSEQI